MEVPSLLTYITEERSIERHGTLLVRVTMLSAIGSNLPDKQQLIEEYLTHMDARGIADATTGLLLVYPKYCHHVLELPYDEVETFLRLVLAQQERGLLEQTSLVHVSDITSRAFRIYAHSIADLGAAKVVEYKTSDAPEVVAAECVVMGIKIGTYLSSKAMSQTQQVLHAMNEEAPELLASQGMIAYLLGSGILDPLEKYFERYHSGLHLLPDNEVVWPLPVRLFPYE